MTKKRGCIEQMIMKNISLLNDHDFYREMLCLTTYTLRNWTHGEKTKKIMLLHSSAERGSAKMSTPLRNACTPMRKWQLKALIFSDISPYQVSAERCTHLRNDYSFMQMVGDFTKLTLTSHFLNNFSIPQSVRTSVEPFSTKVMVT